MLPVPGGPPAGVRLERAGAWKGTRGGTTLTGAQGVPIGGDPDGSGEARFVFYPNKHKICYTIQVSDIARATSAHLQRPPRARSAP